MTVTDRTAASEQEFRDRIAAFETAPTPPEVREAAVDLLLEEVRETIGLGALVAKARREGLYCCSVGCGSGGCETCPCCCAGWCVSGIDGLPEAADDLAIWLEIAAEHNPAAAAVAAYRATQDGGAEEAVLVTWRDCSCDWATKFCDEEHARRSFVPRAVLATQDGGCPTCAGRTRETVGMVCQTCGTDYAPQAGDGAR